MIAVFKHLLDVGKQLYAKAGCLPLRVRYKRYSRYSGALWPVSASRIRDGQQRLPYIRVPIVYTRRDCRIAVESGSDSPLSPSSKPITQLGAFRSIDPSSEWLDQLTGRPAAHPHDDAARKDGVGKPVQPRQRNRAVSRNFLGLDRRSPNNAGAGDPSAAMPGVQQSADFLVILSLRAEDGVDPVKENGRSSVFVGDLAE